MMQMEQEASPTSMMVAANMDKTITKYWNALKKDVVEEFGIVEAATYTVFALILVVGYHMFSDGIFSSIITFASVVQFLGMVLTVAKVEKEKHFGILSITTMQLYVPVYVFRLACTLFNEGYLPIDRSGDWAYQIADCLSLVCVVYLLLKSYKNTTVKEEKYFPAALITAACFVLACYIHPRHNLGTWADTFWTASLYVETFVMMPQLRLVAAEMSCDGLTSHSIACTSAYRTMNFYFWWVCRKELIRARTPCPIPSYFVVGALCIQTILLFDFMFYYLKAAANRCDFNITSLDYIV